MSITDQFTVSPAIRTPARSLAMLASTVVLTSVWLQSFPATSLIRLAPSVHGDGDTGLLPQLISIARKRGRFAYVGDGQNRWPAVHWRDVVRLFRLALEKGLAGARYHGVADEGILFRSIAEIIGRQLSIPVASVTVKDAAKNFSWFGDFMSTD